MKQDNNKKITIGLFGDSFFPMADGVIMVMDNYARRLCKYANVIVFVPEYLTKKYDDNYAKYCNINVNYDGMYKFANLYNEYENAETWLNSWIESILKS